MADQIIINVTDAIPLPNQATIDGGDKVGNTYDKSQLDTKLKDAKSGIKGNATQANAPTPWTSGDDDLFESYRVVEPIDNTSTWYTLADATNKLTFPITQDILNDNEVLFSVKNGVVSVFLSLKNNELADGQVTTEKTDFAKNVKIFGSNRFDKSTITTGVYINELDGAESENASYDATDFIQVNDLQGGFVSMSLVQHGAFYDQNKIFLSGFSIPTGKVPVPSNAYFTRTSMYSGTKETFQVNAGESLLPYESYVEPVNGVLIKNLILAKENKEEEIFFVHPSEIYAVAGRQIDFLFESFIITNIGRKLSEYTVSAFGGYGKFLSDRTRLVPSADTTFDFRVERLPSISIENSISVKHAPLSNGSGVTRKVLVIGDSTVNSGYLIKAINDFFALDTMNVTFIGTRNTLGIAHEGRSGWSYEGYLTQASISGISNPFFDGTTFNFSNYLTTTSQTIGANDWVFIQLGINDLYSTSGSFSEGDIEKRVQEMKTCLTEMISQIHGENSNIRIGLIMTTPPAISQDATGNLLSSAYYSSEYYMKKGLLKWWNELLESYDNATAKSNKIYLIPCNIVLDRVNNFQAEEQDIDAFNTNKKIVQIDDVHPSESGYKQMATAYIGAIKYFA